MERSKCRSIIGAWVLVSSISNETDGRKLTVVPVVREPHYNNNENKRENKKKGIIIMIK